MGKPTSCFKILTCGGDSKDHEDFDVPEATGEKRGWSFRKRSATQRVLSNSVIAEASPPSEFKDSLEKANSKSVTDSVDEKPQLSCPENAKPFEAVNSTQDEDENDDQVEESIAIVVQTAIRGLLARMALAKLKSVVRLQAAVRGHVVRRQAVGTLRCIQAIVRMQALVRARSSLRDKSEDKEFDESKSMYVSIEKLLSNRFARLLLDSSPKTATINIKCEPLKSDSAWKWLERWMSASSVDSVEQNEAETNSEKARNGKEENFVSQLDNGTENQVSDEKKSWVEPEGEAELIAREDERLEAQASEAASSSSSKEPEEMEEDSIMEAEIDKSSPDQMQEQEPEPEPVYPQSQSDYNPETKAVLCEQPENDCRKSVFGSRKATNPAFIAAQSRFEALSSTANSGKSASFETKELDSSENFSLPGSRAAVSGSSECGTELSISSTLDSPDRCENIPDSNRSTITAVEDDDVPPAISSPNLSQPIPDEPQPSDLVISESIVSGDSSGTIEDKPEINMLHQPPEVESETRDQACRLSPEASPKSHITVPESEGTPSSQLSVKSNKNKVDERGSKSKRKSLSVSKKSNLKNTHNSGSRNGPDHSAKDHKIGKRLGSSGSARPDSAEPESRDSASNNNSLPHFMQATESARAKLNSNNSPRSSPDIQDREVQKRRSLSGINGRQGSPRIQRSMSQAQQQSAKGTENKWQR